MATTTDREPSAGLPPTRPFTCSWPKGCPKVSELWACPIFPPSTYFQLTKADCTLGRVSTANQTFRDITGYTRTKDHTAAFTWAVLRALYNEAH